MPKIRLSVALMLLLGSLGCGKKEGAAPTTRDSKKESAGTPTLPPSAGNPGESSAAALAAAGEFLKTVQSGQATPALLTPAFKKVIAPAELDADKAAGFSDSDVRGWLAAAKGETLPDGLSILQATADFAIAASTGKTGKTYLRLVRVETNWRIDFVLLSSPSVLNVEPGESAASNFAAAAFAQAVVTKKFPAMEALLSNTVRGKLASPLFETDKDLGYNRLKLQSAFAELLGGKWQIVSFGSTGTGSKLIQLVETDTKKSLGLTIHLTAGPTPGVFLIDDYQQK